MRAADRAVEAARRARREQRGCAHGVAEGGVGRGGAGAVADGCADIRTGPAPCRHYRRLEKHGGARVRARRINRAGGIELVVEAHPRDLGSNAGIEADRERRRVQRIGGRGRDAAEIEIEVLDLAGPIAAQANFGAGAHREAGLCRMAHEARGDRVRAGGDGRSFHWNLDRHVDRIAVVIEFGDDGIDDAVDHARGDG